MRFRTLGTVQVWDGRTWSAIPAAQLRVVLAVLLVEAGRVVTTDRLAYELWREAPPRRAASTVQVYVGRLRRLLGDAAPTALVTRSRGYELVVAHADVDAHVFERLATAGRQARARGQLDAAVYQLGDALALWRGPALADVPGGPTVAAEAARLEACRLAALEERLAAQLELGRHGEVVDKLQYLVRELPLRERLHAQLMVALYRCGRRAEALDAYRDARRVLVAEVGLEPGPELCRLERAILADDPELAAPARLGISVLRRVAPAQLPADPAGFTGRQAHLAQLDALLDGAGDQGEDGHGDGGGPPRALAIGAIVGTAGVGKTALAVHWAHRVAGRFPDGQLQVNLRGHGAGPPRRPVDVLGGFLSALGVPAERVPGDVEQAAALYRSVLAGRRVLVLLDNASHADQVRLLLPGNAGCAVVVTSRNRLDGLVARDGAARLALDALSPGEAGALLARLVGAHRVAAEPAAAAALATRCAYLPLALRIAAASLAAHPRATMAEYLTTVDADRDLRTAVRGAFDHTYRALPGAARGLFRRLGLLPGPDVTPAAAAALAGIGPAQAARLLARLAEAHLVEQPAPGRYAPHDLLRRYAAEQASTEDSEPDRSAALDRLYDHYLRAVDAATNLFCPQMLRLPAPTGPARVPVRFADHTDSLRWLEAERANLVAAVTHAVAHGPRRAAWRLADALRGFLYQRMHTGDWLAVAEAGLAAAEADGDPHGQAAARGSLAGVHGIHARYDQAIDEYTAALALCRKAGWAEGEAATLGNLGLLFWLVGRLDEAAAQLEGARAINARTGRLASQAANHCSLGMVYGAQGRLAQAAGHYRRSVLLYQRIEAHHGEAATLANLGEAYHHLGRLAAAAGSLAAALAAFRAVSDRVGEVDAVRRLAGVRRDEGDRGPALELARTAVALATQTGHGPALAMALTAQAHAQLRFGAPDQAIERYRQALDAARDAGLRDIAAEALTGLALAYRRTGRLGLAAAHAVESHLVAREAGYRLLEGQALTALGAVHLARGDPQLSVHCAEQAGEVLAGTGHRLGIARAHLVADAALRGAERPAQARAHRRLARALFARVGAPLPQHARELGLTQGAETKPGHETERACQECRSPLPVAGTGRPARYCSGRCRLRAWRRRQATTG